MEFCLASIALDCIVCVSCCFNSLCTCVTGEWRHGLCYNHYTTGSGSALRKWVPLHPLSFFWFSFCNPPPPPPLLPLRHFLVHLLSLFQLTFVFISPLGLHLALKFGLVIKQFSNLSFRIYNFTSLSISEVCLSPKSKPAKRGDGWGFGCQNSCIQSLACKTRFLILYLGFNPNKTVILTPKGSHGYLALETSVNVST